MGFRALGLGGLGFKPRELQAGVKDLEDLGFGLESRLGFRGLGFRVLGLGFRVKVRVSWWTRQRAWGHSPRNDALRCFRGERGSVSPALSPSPCLALSLSVSRKQGHTNGFVSVCVCDCVGIGFENWSVYILIGMSCITWRCLCPVHAWY